MMECPKCHGDGFIIHNLTGPFSPDKKYTDDCPLNCEVSQKFKRETGNVEITSEFVRGWVRFDVLAKLQSQLAVAKEALEFVEGRMNHSCNIEYGNSVGMENCKLCRVRAALEKLSSCAW